MKKNAAIILKNELAELERLTLVVEEFGESCQLPAKAIFQTNLALEEIVSNIISYGYEDVGEHSIQVELSWDSPWLSVQIRDDGRPFNPLALAAPDLDQSVEERSIGGLGIHFVRQLMTEVVYERQVDHNILLLRKEWAETA